MSSPQQTLLCLYRYDPLDRLTGHVQSEAPVRQRFYCKSRLATEVQGAAGYSIVQHEDLLLAQQQRQVGSLDTTLLATDLQRSVLQTIKASLPRQAIAYSPYGHRPSESGLSSLLGFNGERPDPVTGCYLLGNGYRAFNPVLMRFNSPDDFSPFGKGGLNSYAYCNGEPINLSDSNGHFPLPSFLAKPFTRMLRGLGRPGKTTVNISGQAKLFTEHTYSLGPTFTFERVNTTHTKSVTKTAFGNNYRLKEINKTDTSGKTSNLKTIERRKNHIFDPNDEEFKRKYSALTGSEIKTLTSNTRTPEMESLDRINYWKEVMREYDNLQHLIPEGNRRAGMVEPAVLARVKRGEIRGVHPDYKYKY